MVDVSIIIPAYNACLYIEECVKSVRNQSFKNWECIVVDDGSTDNTYEAVLNLVGDDERFQIYRQKNGGVSVARNVGIEKSRGRYVIFLDSDDFLQKDYVEIMYEIANENQFDILLSDHQIITADSRVVTSMEHGRRLSINSRSFNWKELLETAWLDCCWAKIFKRSVIGSSRFPVGISWGEDTIFVLSTISKGINVGIDMCNGYIHRITENGLCSRFDENRPFYMLQYYHSLFDFSDKISAGGGIEDAISIKLSKEMITTVLELSEHDLSFSEKYLFIKNLFNDEQVNNCFKRGICIDDNPFLLKILARISHPLPWLLFSYLAARNR